MQEYIINPAMQDAEQTKFRSFICRKSCIGSCIKGELCAEFSRARRAAPFLSYHTCEMIAACDCGRMIRAQHSFERITGPSVQLRCNVVALLLTVEVREIIDAR